MKKLLLIDNYDSFTYNLLYSFNALGAEVTVCRNDIERSSLNSLINESDAIVISPGPGKPSEAGHCLDIITEFYQAKPILGICLGHQAIVQAFGGEIVSANEIVHGKTATLEYKQRGLFSNIISSPTVARYHSLQAQKSTMPEDLRVDAVTQDEQTVMAVSHRHLPVFGVQFHPESIMTKQGDAIFEAFLSTIK